jgi:galactoside O-acetyltransferase
VHNPFDPGYYCSEELRDFGFKTVGENVLVAKNCTIIGLDRIELGDNSRIDGFCTIIVGDGFVRLGRYVHIHTSCVIGGRGGVQIGDYGGASHGCQILSATDDFTGRYLAGGIYPPGCTKPKIAPVSIGPYVPIGARSTIMPGVTIGEGAAICAHSLVTRDIGEWKMAAGTPAVERCRRSRQLLALVPDPPHPLSPSETKRYGRSAPSSR